MDDAGNIAEHRQQNIEPELPVGPTSRNTPRGAKTIAKIIFDGSVAVKAIITSQSEIQE
jgi:hypothetical protein